MIDVHDTTDVRQVIDELYAAWAANDADAIAALYVDDGTVVRPGSYQRDREAIRENMAGAFAGPFRGSRVLEEPQDVRLVTDDVAVVIGVAGVLMADETDLPADRRRRATWVLVRKDGAWHIAAYHNCPAD